MVGPPGAGVLLVPAPQISRPKPLGLKPRGHAHTLTRTHKHAHTHTLTHADTLRGRHTHADTHTNTRTLTDLAPQWPRPFSGVRAAATLAHGVLRAEFRCRRAELQPAGRKLLCRAGPRLHGPVRPHPLRVSSVPLSIPWSEPLDRRLPTAGPPSRLLPSAVSPGSGCLHGPSQPPARLGPGPGPSGDALPRALRGPLLTARPDVSPKHGRSVTFWELFTAASRSCPGMGVPASC